MVATAALVLLAAATGAEARYGFSFGPSTGPKDSSFTLSFRAPYDENSDCCSEVSYQFWLRGPRDTCIRDFGRGWGTRTADGRFEDLVDLAGSRHAVLRINGSRYRPDSFITAGDFVVLRFRAPPCVGRYRGHVTFLDLELSSTTTTFIGAFRFRVTAGG